nr:hypothetical protein CFP56_44945 [Quercus suber]
MSPIIINPTVLQNLQLFEITSLIALAAFSQNRQFPTQILRRFYIVVDPSVGPSKTPRVRSTTGDVPDEDMHGDPIAIVVEDGDDEVDVDIADAAHTDPLPPSLHAMMETIMMTQVAHRQLLHGLLAKFTAFQVDVADYRCPVPPSPPSNSS